jgi:RNA methyltransferase, TrmH family
MSRPEPRGSVRAITSLQNERVKLIRSLEMRKARRETNLFVAEGASVLVTARDAGWAPRMLVFLAGSAQAGVAQGLLVWAEAAGAECLEVSQAVLAKLAAKDNPQTMLGVFEQRWAAEPAEGQVAQDSLWVALEAVRDPGNLGTILRTADAVGASGVVLVGTCCDAYSREAVRASMGSIFNVPLVRASAERLRALATTWTGDIVGTHLTAVEDFRAVAYRAPPMLVMGSEGPGLSPELAAVCSRMVKIPMAGRLDSLNLAVATALMLYEMRKDRLHL